MLEAARVYRIRLDRRMSKCIRERRVGGMGRACDERAVVLSHEKRTSEKFRSEFTRSWERRT